MGRLRVRHLQALEVLQRLGSLRQVALELGLPQAATVALFNDLEHAFGTSLLQRERSGSTLTPAGLAVLARARVALQEVGLASELARRSGSTGGRVRLGASPYLISALLPPLVAALQRQWPTLELDVREGTLDNLVAELSRGELDAVLGSVDRATALSGSLALEASLLADEVLCVVAGRGHALHGRRKASLAQVLAGPWVLPHGSSHIRTLVDSAVFEAGGAPLLPRVECRGLLNLLAIASTAGLLTVAPRAELLKPAWRGLVSALASPLRLQAPPYVFVSRRYAQPLAELQGLRRCAEEVAARLWGRPGGDAGRATCR